MEDVFLGYKREDVDRAEQVAAGLRAEGFTVFFDVAVPVGEHWDDVLEQRVDGVKAVVVLWSDQSRGSVPVRGEAHRALELKKFAPARIDSCKIPMNFSTVQTADLRGWKLGDFQHVEWRRLISSIQAFVAKAQRAERGSRIKSIADILAEHSKAEESSQSIPSSALLESIRATTSQFLSPSAADIAMLRNGANKGETWAQYALGVLHLFGDGVSKDPAASLMWFMNSAERGSTGSYFALGVMIESGIGVQPNLNAAFVAYERAANAGHEFAAECVRRLEPLVRKVA